MIDAGQVWLTLTMAITTERKSGGQEINQEFVAAFEAHRS
jgi:hypothetical protein